MKLKPSQELTTRYEDYRAKIIARRPQYAKAGFKGGGAGNEQRRFHGTRKICDFGENGNTRLCADSSCPTCSICRGGFLINRAGVNFGWLRFGQGIYLSSTSSKSDDYSHITEGGYKALLVIKVLVGKGKKMYEGDSTLRAAPVGYDSVLGEVGQELNYDELVVYDEAAVLPIAVILYTTYKA
eukprot:CAMPEP_0174269538 /NCGR_PEP_ID=MMETSP0439-20130205/41405_1 /TAXON_ID=0 /ORGANISM="Stereomyxa ramosa, Strain Chinc5" /LENGTH=182 /DNA_ID=CAMNT_0015358377 /DNA_START=1346 /DNA_END=1894 /DNA_ORIENTATION=+